jgi:hypothetical protein
MSMSTHASSSLARWLVRWYPRLWRARYAEELLDLLAERPPTWADVWDLTRHALYAHLHPDLSLTGDESLHERLVALMRALRSSEIAVFCAFVSALIAWLQFGGLVDGGPYESLVGTGASWPAVRLEPNNPLGLAMAAQSAAVDVAFLAVLAGGVPLAVAAWRGEPRVRRLFLVPVAAVVGAFLPVPIALLLVGPVATINLTFTTPITVAYCVWFVGLAAASTWAIGRAIATGNVSDRLVRFAFAPSLVAALALLLLLCATVAWGVVAHLEFPQLFDRGDLALGHATLATWAIDVAALALATLVAMLGIIRGGAARTASRATSAATSGIMG